MAVTKDEIKSSYPLPVYNYRVEIGEASVAFSEVSGLSSSYETHTYKESPVESGVPGPRILYMPAQINPVNLTLKKGVVKAVSIAALYDWLRTVQINQIEKKDIHIRLLDEKGDPVISWKVSNAFPTKLEAPSFSADSQDAAVETMELMADRVTIEEA